MSEAESAERIPAPEWLTKRGRKIFRELVAQLGADAKDSDHSLYCDFAQVSADIETLTGDVAKEGHTVSTADSVKANPKAQLLSIARGQLANLRRDLNLTPKARAEKVAAKSAAPFGGMNRRG